MPLQPFFVLFFPVPDFIVFFVCRNTDILVEIRLDELKGFSAGLEEDVIELRNSRASAQHL